MSVFCLFLFPKNGLECIQVLCDYISSLSSFVLFSLLLSSRDNLSVTSATCPRGGGLEGTREKVTRVHALAENHLIFVRADCIHACEMTVLFLVMKRHAVEGRAFYLHDSLFYFFVFFVHRKI